MADVVFTLQITAIRRETAPTTATAQMTVDGTVVDAPFVVLALPQGHTAAPIVVARPGGPDDQAVLIELVQGLALEWFRSYRTTQTTTVEDSNDTPEPTNHTD